VPQATLTWRAAPFATAYEVYFGSTPATLARVASVAARLVANPPDTYSWMPPGPLAAGTTFYWKVVARTHATPRDPSLVGDSGVWSFTTLGTRATGVPAHPAVFRRSTGRWYVQGRPEAVRYGLATDIPIPGDYDGDGSQDTAVWRPSTGTWFILSSTSGESRIPWGSGTLADVPVPGDYDGDGRSDIAIWRPGTGTWWILQSSRGSTPATRLQIDWGEAGDVPVPADYDGDGTTDIGVFRPRTGRWWILTSGSAFRVAERLVVQWGDARFGDLPVPADFDGDGRADIAVWRPDGGWWWILPSADAYEVGSRLLVQWGSGQQDDVPIPADYDGDGRADVAVWRPASASWFIRRSLTGYSTHWTVQWGDSSAGDVPLGAGWAALRRYLQR